MTGATEFSSNAVLVAGSDCLIVSEMAEITTTLPSDSFAAVTQAFRRACRVVLFLTAILVILLLTPLLIAFLIPWIVYKIYEKACVKCFPRNFPGYPSRDWDDEEDNGFSKVCQPKPSPQPPDSVELELPFVSEQGIESFPTRL